MKWGVAALYVAVFVVLSASVPANAASVDCSTAAAADEIAICNDPDLSRRDEAMAAQTRVLMARLPVEAQAGVLHSEQAWLRGRAACGGDVACLQSSYDGEAARLESLQVDLQAFGYDQARLAAVLRFRQTGQCDHCDLAEADLSYIAPAANVVGPQELCSITARAEGSFDGAHLDHGDFTTCQSKRDSRLASLSFDGARLRGTDLSESVFGVVSFRSAELAGAKFNGAILFRVDMTGANLRRATFIGAKSEREAMHGFGSSFANANMQSTSLGGAELYADFEGADLTGADLTGAHLSGFVVGGRNASPDARAYFPGRLDDNGHPAPPPRFGGKVNLTDAVLSGGSFFGQTSMARGGFSGAILCRTLLPDGNLSDRDCR